MEPLLTRSEVARWLAISERQVDRLVAAKELRRVKLGARCSRYNRKEVERFLAHKSRERGGTA